MMWKIYKYVTSSNTINFILIAKLKNKVRYNTVLKCECIYYYSKFKNYNSFVFVAKQS